MTLPKKCGYILLVISFSLCCQFHFPKVLIIEVNTVPGMTPSTVLIHQVFPLKLFLLRGENYFASNNNCFEFAIGNSTSTFCFCILLEKTCNIIQIKTLTGKPKNLISQKLF